LTPHLGASTGEAQTRVAEQITNQIIAYLKTGEMINAVNASPFSDDIKPYLDLVQKMGYFVGEIYAGSVNAVNVTCFGDLAGSDVRGISTAGLVGLLYNSGESINLVSAPGIARKRGILTSETTSKRNTDYRSMLSLEVSIDGYDKPIKVDGIMFEKKGPRIVGLTGYDIEFEPKGNLLISSHNDVPGIIKYISGVLAKEDINIGTINLCREERGKDAIAVFRVDSLLDGDLLKKVGSKNKNIYSLKQIEMPERLGPYL